MESAPDGGSNAGIVVGSRAVLFVDTRMTPALGRNLREIGDELAGDGQRLVALTHYHGDHCFGASSFPDATLIASSRTRDALASRWRQQVDHLEQLRPERAAEFAAARHVPPHVLIDGTITLDLGDVEVELRAVGPAHTPGDVVALVDDVAYVGDLVFNRHWPMVFDADLDGWLRLLDGDELRRRTIVPGHGAVGGPETLDAMADCLRLLARAAANGAGPDPWDAPGFDDWLHADRVAHAVEHLRKERE